MSTTNQNRRAPRGLGRSGKRLWRSIVDEYDLDTHEALLLAEACRVADRLDQLAEALTEAPLTTQNARGDEVSQPLMVEARQQGLVFARLLASLRLPVGDEDDDRGGLQRPQRRGAARGTYGLRAVK